jgi:hypothetical protein
MAMVLPSSHSHGSATPLPEGGNLEDWPYLERALLIASRSSRLCLTCRWFRHAAVEGAIPQIGCERHRSLLVHGEHLTRRCQEWSADQP